MICQAGFRIDARETENRGRFLSSLSMREFNQQYCRRLADLSVDDPINFFLMANIYSLLDFTAHTDGLLDLCVERGISVVVGLGEDLARALLLLLPAPLRRRGAAVPDALALYHLVRLPRRVLCSSGHLFRLQLAGDNANLIKRYSRVT